MSKYLAYIIKTYGEIKINLSNISLQYKGSPRFPFESIVSVIVFEHSVIHFTSILLKPISDKHFSIKGHSNLS